MEMKSEMKKCRGPNLLRTKYGRGCGERGWGPKIKVPQNVMKHTLVLEFLKSDKILGIFL